MKKGNSIISVPLLIAISTIAISTLAILLINILTPYILYEKLLSTTLRYMFIIEEYGYLNNMDKQNLINDLINQGFDEENIEIDATDIPQLYGKQTYLSINYNYKLHIPFFKNNTLSINKKEYTVPMKVIKYGVSTI